MMFRSPVAKVALIVAMVLVLTCGSFGVLTMGMSMGMDGQMNPCPFSSGTAVCTMNPLEHIAASQSLFTMIAPLQSLTLTLLLLVFSFASTFLLFGRPFAPPRRTISYAALRHRRYRPAIALQDAFSNGILNPKTF